MYNPMQNYMMPLQTQYSPQNAFQSQQPTLIRVTGIEGAKAYQMQPNGTVALFDNNEDLMYIKSTDGAGFPTIRTFAFSEVLDVKPQQVGDYVSREEFLQLQKEVKDYVKQFISTKDRKHSTTGGKPGKGTDEQCQPDA